VVESKQRNLEACFDYSAALYLEPRILKHRGPSNSKDSSPVKSIDR
jgi:hypothetical protein